ncbi:MAG: hypothetical protein ACHQ53_04915 [Polyangiales bacterium]
MRCSTAVWLWLAIAACGSGQAKQVPTAPPQPRAHASALRPQPKPGERVRQPELDSYCSEPQRGAAFYYHGGRPVIPLAHKDGCAPLFITECEATGHCYPPRDQEPGMWCCTLAEHASVRPKR